jgi:hypothetical protein
MAVVLSFSLCTLRFGPQRFGQIEGESRFLETISTFAEEATFAENPLSKEESFKLLAINACTRVVQAVVERVEAATSKLFSNLLFRFLRPDLTLSVL